MSAPVGAADVYARYAELAQIYETCRQHNVYLQTMMVQGDAAFQELRTKWVNAQKEVRDNITLKTQVAQKEQQLAACMERVRELETQISQGLPPSAQSVQEANAQLTARLAAAEEQVAVRNAYLHTMRSDLENVLVDLETTRITTVELMKRTLVNMEYMSKVVQGLKTSLATGAAPETHAAQAVRLDGVIRRELEIIRSASTQPHPVASVQAAARWRLMPTVGSQTPAPNPSGAASSGGART